MAMVRVLITGGTGFIGSHLVRTCLDRGDAVTVIARPSSDPWRLDALLSGIDLRRLQVEDKASLAGCLRETQPEVIFHLGASTRLRRSPDFADLRGGIEWNLLPLAVLLAGAAMAEVQPKAFVRTGSIAEYGDAPLPYHEQGREEPRGAYGASMLAGTKFMMVARGRLSFPAVTARLALTYGPMQSTDFLLPSLIEHCLLGRPIDVSRPNDRRDLIYVDDVVDALVMIAGRPAEVDPVVNVGTGRAPTMRELAALVAEKTGAAPELVRMGRQDAADAEELRCASDRIGTGLGWAPKVDLDAGVERTVQWTRLAQNQGAGREPGKPYP
jgi:nucleoside-diphosphate-sugar epimerase